MIFAIIVICIVFIDNLLMFVFCKYNKNRNCVWDNKRTEENEVDSHAEQSGEKLSKSKNSRGLRERILHLLSSLMRVNILFVGIIPSHLIRWLLYRYVYQMDIAQSAVIYYGAEIRAPWNIHIGEGTIIGDKAILDGRFGIWIGDHSNLSTGVWIWTLQHNVQSPMFSVAGEGKAVIVGDRAWLSTRTVVLPGVSIGKGGVLAAGAIATKNIGDYVIAGGVPAKEIGKRNNDLVYEFDGSHMMFL